MKLELKNLELEIFKHRRVRRIGLIRDAWEAYVKTLEPRDSLSRRVIEWMKRSVGDV